LLIRPNSQIFECAAEYIGDEEECWQHIGEFNEMLVKQDNEKAILRKIKYLAVGFRRSIGSE
jgi:hypothetical protein